MRTLYTEGLAIHDGPESCVGDPRGRSEALTGVRAGRLLSLEMIKPGCRRGRKRRKAIPVAAFSRAVMGPRGVGEPVHARDLFMLRTGRSHDHNECAYRDRVDGCVPSGGVS